MVLERKGHGNFKSILMYLLPQEIKDIFIDITNYRGKGNKYLEYDSLYTIILVSKWSISVLSSGREMRN